MERNLFLYWEGGDYKLISILRNIIYLHSTNGKGYKVHLINHTNLKEYINEIPDYFYDLCYAHQADFVRVNVICDYGGIWLDSDTLVMTSLDSLFEFDNGFLILENNTILWTGVFGFTKNNPLMLKWRETMMHILNIKKNTISWTEIGNTLLENLKKSNNELFANIKIFNGLDTIYPSNWDKCVSNFIDAPYENYNNLIKNYQPFIVLVNSVYKKIENTSIDDLLNANMPLNYFINKSFENMTHLTNYNFIEIGTSNFDALIEECNDNSKGISVEPIKHYLDALPNKKKCN